MAADWQCLDYNETVRKEKAFSLFRRRARIQGMETKGNLCTINAEVPLAEMFGYATAIRSLSKGRSSYSMEPSHFEEVPSQVKAAILEQKA